MDIFLRDVAFAATEIDVLVDLARILHRPPFPLDPPINFHIELFLQSRSNNHRGMGILTVPTVDIGKTFLRLYGSTGLSIKGRTIRFSQSTKPLSQGILEMLLSTTWEDPLELQQEQERKAQASEPIALAKVYYGHFRRDGSFSAESAPPGIGTITCDLNLRQLKITMDLSTRRTEDTTDHFPLLFALLSISGSFQPKISAIYSPSQVKKLIASGVSRSSPTDARPRVFLESSTPPIFEKQSIFSEQKNDAKRCSSLQDNHVMLGCNVLCLTFHSTQDLTVFRKRCEELGLPAMQKRYITTHRRSAYSIDNLKRLADFLKTLEFSLNFQVQKIVTESILEPLEVISLGEDILRLQKEYGIQAHAIFRYFAETLGGSRRELISRRQRRDAKRTAVAEAHATQPPPASLSKQLREAVDAYSERQNQPLPFSSTSPVFYLSYHLIITPSDRILEGPLPDQTNSVLRRFGNHDCFLRVSFNDENRSKLRRDMGLSITQLLKSRCHNMLTNGFQLVGRKYEFLGYSMSGLKDHSVWFVTPFEFNGSTVNASRIRDSLVRHLTIDKLILT